MSGSSMEEWPASIVLIACGVGAIAVGALGFDEVRDKLLRRATRPVLDRYGHSAAPDSWWHAPSRDPAAVGRDRSVARHLARPTPLGRRASGSPLPLATASGRLPPHYLPVQAWLQKTGLRLASGRTAASARSGAQPSPRSKCLRGFRRCLLCPGEASHSL